MPRLHYSNHLESLIVPLAQELEKRDPLERVDIVVPNYSLEKWISLKIAQYNGIVANLRFITLEKIIFEGIKEKLKGKNYALIKKETIQCLLQEILREKIVNSNPLWKPLKSYLSPKIHINSQAKEKRLFQLSNRLTHLFQEYEFSRNEELINIWTSGKNALDISQKTFETWQKELWNELFGYCGKVTKYNKRISSSSDLKFEPELYTLTQLYRLCEIKLNRDKSKFFKGKKIIPNKALHIFGVSYLSKFHQKALTEYLSKFREINVYSLNPCMEFWEDVKSLGESKLEILKTIESKNTLFSREPNFSEKDFLIGEELKNYEDNPFLEAWGRPGRENIRLLNQWSNWDFSPWFVENNSTISNANIASYQDNSLLNKLQQDILFREPRHVKSLEMKQDESIMVLACSNPRREVEAVASLIWDWIQNNPDLMLNECAVIANNMNIYQHEIEQVFGEVYNLPYHLIDGVSSIASRLEDAANALLELCYTEYTRKDLFNLIKNPFFVSIFEDNSIENNITQGESLNIEKWMQWADELNIFSGIDSEWSKINGYNHLDNDKFSWEQGFNRLTLGDMISSSSDTETFTIGKKEIVPADIPQEWSVEAARFILIVRSLIADTRDLQKWRMKAKDWANYILILIKTYLKPSSEVGEEVFQKLLRNTQAIKELDLAQESEHLFSFNTIIEFFKQKQASVSMHRGHYLAEGITVSSFKPMRPIPFKAVFLLGLGEGLFPATLRKDTLDLRHIPERLSSPIEGRIYRERRIGDVSETERDRYMFLETLISTRKHLVLSYVSNTENNDLKLSPSSIIQTLLDELNRGYLKNKFKEIIHPLKPYSLDYFPELTSFKKNKSNSNVKLINYNFSSFSQARSYLLRQLFNDNFPGYERISPEIISPEINKLFENNFSSEKKLEADFKKNCTFSISHLRKFLETPLQTSVSQQIGFFEEKEDNFTDIEEPFILEKLNEWALLRKTWDHALGNLDNKTIQDKYPDWEKVYIQFSKRMELEGAMPSSIFKIAIQKKHLRILTQWSKQLTEILNTDWQTLQKNMYRFHFGPLNERVLNSKLAYNQIFRPTISIDSSKNSSSKLVNFLAKIKGRSEWWYNDRQNNWFVIYLSEKEIKEKTWLRHFLDILILKLSGIIGTNAKISGLCISAKENFKLKKIQIPSTSQAHQYFVNLIQDMQYRNINELMPIESVLELSKENLDEAKYNIRYNSWVEEKLRLPKDNLDISSRFGPVNFLEDFSSPENPYKIMNRRFYLFYKTIKSL